MLGIIISLVSCSFSLLIALHFFSDYIIFRVKTSRLFFLYSILCFAYFLFQFLALITETGDRQFIIWKKFQLSILLFLLPIFSSIIKDVIYFRVSYKLTKIIYSFSGLFCIALWLLPQTSKEMMLFLLEKKIGIDSYYLILFAFL